MSFQIAELYATIGVHDSALDAGLAKAKGKCQSFVGSVGGVFSGLASTLGPLAAAAGAFAGLSALKDGVFAASDLAETQSKVNVVFGASAPLVTAFGDAMAEAFGSSKQDMLDAAAGFGLVGKAAGMTQGQAANLAVTFGKLADDASSFYNVPLEEALGTLKSALVGESEPIRRFGVLLNEDAVKAEALKLGLTGVGKQLTEQSKVMARASLIQKGLSDATGDHAKTAEGFSNQWRELTGRLTESAAAVGSVVLPVFTQLLHLLNAGMKALAGIGKSISNVFGQLAGGGMSLFGASAAPKAAGPAAGGGNRYGGVAPALAAAATTAKDPRAEAAKALAAEKEHQATDVALEGLRKQDEAKKKAALREREDAALHKYVWVEAYAEQLRSYKSFTELYVKMGAKAFDEVKKQAAAVYDNPKLRESALKIKVDSKPATDAAEKFGSVLKEKVSQAFDFGAILKQKGAGAANALADLLYFSSKRAIDKVENEKQGVQPQQSQIFGSMHEYGRDLQLQILNGQKDQQQIAKNTADAARTLKEMLTELKNNAGRGVRAILAP